ncbi:hypothetical protein [Limisphaera sp. 4302-co]|uniref:hypothetical protein n=1 Tax=Limisphaera sp. 4302-co TaxID=3400417 RepID=UPI003C20DA6F
MRLEYREDPREWRRLALASLGGPVLLAGFCWWRGWIGWPVVLAVALSVGLLAAGVWTRPEWFRGYYRALVWTSFHLARLLGFAVLMVIFWLMVVPMGLVLRCFGWDPLWLRRAPDADSYWQKSPPPTGLDRLF